MRSVFSIVSDYKKIHRCSPIIVLQIRRWNGGFPLVEFRLHDGCLYHQIALYEPAGFFKVLRL